MIRQSTVDGQFYPGDACSLKKMIASFVPKGVAQRCARGLILPHAGYLYSGKVAVATVSGVLPRTRLVILGPKHTPYGAAFSVWEKGVWQTPLGDVPIDEVLASQLLAQKGILSADSLAHRQEHSIEVLLPILQHCFGAFRFVPIACETTDVKTYQRVAVQIVHVLKPYKEEILFVASSDMTHYEPEAAVRKKDRLALEQIVNFDEEALVETVNHEEISMCGVAPVAILLSCLKRLGARKAQVVLYQTSAETTGDANAVVGYAGVMMS